jgi:hypothetical protein
MAHFLRLPARAFRGVFSYTRGGGRYESKGRNQWAHGALREQSAAHPNPCARPIESWGAYSERPFSCRDACRVASGAARYFLVCACLTNLLISSLPGSQRAGYAPGHGLNHCAPRAFNKRANLRAARCGMDDSRWGMPALASRLSGRRAATCRRSAIRLLRGPRYQS